MAWVPSTLVRKNRGVGMARPLWESAAKFDDDVDALVAQRLGGGVQVADVGPDEADTVPQPVQVGRVPA